MVIIFLCVPGSHYLPSSINRCHHYQSADFQWLDTPLMSAAWPIGEFERNWSCSNPTKQCNWLRVASWLATKFIKSNHFHRHAVFLKYGLCNWRIRLDTYLHGHGHIMQTLVSKPLPRLFLPCARVLEPILSFVEAACMALEPDLLVVNAACIGFVWSQLSRMFSHPGGVFLRDIFVGLYCPYLESMFYRGINHYKIPIGCVVAASPPRMKAKRAGLWSLMKSLDGAWIGRVCKTLLLDILLGIFPFFSCYKFEEAGFLVWLMQEHTPRWMTEVSRDWTGHYMVLDWIEGWMHE